MPFTALIHCKCLPRIKSPVIILLASCNRIDYEKLIDHTPRLPVGLCPDDPDLMTGFEAAVPVQAIDGASQFYR